MKDHTLITSLLSQAGWKIKLTRSGNWITSRTESPASNDTTRIYLRSAGPLPEASEDTLRILQELGIE